MADKKRIRFHTSSLNTKVLTPHVIVQTALSSGVTPFVDQFGGSYLYFPANSDLTRNVTYRLYSVQAMMALVKVIEAKLKCQLQVTRKVLKTAMQDFELRAFKQPHVHLECRFTSRNGKLYIDLGDENWNSIVIDDSGWRVQPQQDPMFRRLTHMDALPEPEVGGSLEDLLQFVQLKDPDTKLLLLTWCLSALDSQVPTPIAMFVGNQGAGKTTLCRRLRSLLDPSRVPVLGDHDMKQMVQVLQNHAVEVDPNYWTSWLKYEQ